MEEEKAGAEKREKKRIGVVGAGKISGMYLQNLTGMFGKQVILTGITDLVEERAQKAAREYRIRCLKDADALIACAEVDIVLNLSQPQHHYAVALAAVRGGKHVYNEKPLCVNREEAAALLEAAQEQQVRVGCAPDTFLGAGIQTCRKLIDDGWIGRPLAAVAFMMNHGHEHWHPDPAFYYKTGGGPLFDMGPYYLTALVNLLGPIARVSGSAQQSFKTRTITSEPLNGQVITVEVPTHIGGLGFCFRCRGPSSPVSMCMRIPCRTSKSTALKAPSRFQIPIPLADRSWFAEVRQRPGRKSPCSRTSRKTAGALGYRIWPNPSVQTGPIGLRGNWPTMCWK